MRAIDLHQYFLSLVDLAALGRRNSGDRIFFGDPQTEISRIGTCWLPYLDTLKKAHAKGINVMVVHEPSLYAHGDEAKPFPGTEPERAEKERWIREHGMVLIRCHDVLDAVPGFGIPFAFGRALGFDNDDIVASKTYFNVYRMKRPVSAASAARLIARKLKRFGQPGVAFYGDGRRPVSSIGVGAGCISNPLQFRHLGADLHVALNDSVWTWVQPVIARDTGAPLVVVDHGTSEEAGMIELAAHLRARFPLQVTHFPQGCTFRWVA